MQNVEVVSTSEAAAALARSVGADAALLLADDDTAKMTVVGEDEELISVLASVPIGAAGVDAGCLAAMQQAPAQEVVRSGGTVQGVWARAGCGADGWGLGFPGGRGDDDGAGGQ